VWVVGSPGLSSGYGLCFKQTYKKKGLSSTADSILFLMSSQSLGI